MANYDLTYEGSRVQGILDTGNSLKDAGYIFRGEATPSTVPGTPTERVAYIGGPGTYTNFGGSITVGAGCICVFKYTGSAWSNQVINTGLDSAVNTLQSAITAINNNIGNGYVYAGVATPSTSPVTGKVFYLAVQAGTYTNFGNAVVTAGLNVIKYNGSAWSVDQVIAIDAEPTQGSANLVKSSGVLNSILQNGPAFDLSAYNAQGGVLATYADLSAALTALNALPADFKKGGMSMKFLLSSDNKYVQYLYHGTSTAVADFTNTNNWEKTNLWDRVFNIETLLNESQDMVQPSAIGYPYYSINYVDGALKAQGNQYYMVSGYIDVSLIDTISYSIYNGYANNALIAAYDENKNYIQSNSVASTADKTVSGKWVKANGTAYIRFSRAKSTDVAYIGNYHNSIEGDRAAIKYIEEDIADINKDLIPYLQTPYTAIDGDDGTDKYWTSGVFFTSGYIDTAHIKSIEYTLASVHENTAIIACYDANKVYLKNKSIIVSSGGLLKTSGTWENDGVAFIRISGGKSGTCLAHSSVYQGDDSVFKNAVIIPCINKKSLFKRPTMKICCWIDDDGDLTGMQRVKGVCDNKGIKATFAVNTVNFTESYINTLKQYQEEGYDIQSHSHTHGKYWYPDNVQYDIELIREDIAKTYRSLITNGFCPKMLIYPGGGGSTVETRIAVMQYFDFAFVAWATDGSQDPESANFLIDYTSPYENRFYKHRWFLDPSNNDGFEAYVAKCIEIGRMPVIATHSSASMSAWDENYTKQCVQYLKDQGFTFMTASQAVEIIRPISTLAEMFNAQL